MKQFPKKSYHNTNCGKQINFYTSFTNTNIYLTKIEYL